MGRIVGHVCQVRLLEDDSNGTDLPYASTP